MSEPTPSVPPSEGHRERLRARFLAGAEASLADAALLELLLTYAIPRQDVAPLAGRLLEKFGSLAAVLAAEPAALKTCPGIKENSLVLLKLAGQLRGEPSAPAPTPAAPTISAPVAPPPSPPPPAAVPRSRATVPGPALEISPPPETDCGADDPPHVSDSILEPTWSGERKLQVSNGYSLDPAQLARFLSAVAAKPDAKKIPRKLLMEETGLSYGQTEGLASISAALGLVVPLSQVLTAFGRLVATHDLFLDSLVTLQYGHFLAASNPRNLVWHAVFTDLLINHAPMPQTGWCAWFREKLAGQYSNSTLVKHLAQEVRFVADAYTVRNLSKLSLLTEMPDQTLALRRSCGLLPPVLAAMIYTIGERTKTSLVPFSYLHGRGGSLGQIFAQDAGALRQAVETLHQREWLRFEVRHGLDQVRLIDGCPRPKRSARSMRRCCRPRCGGSCPR